MNFFRLVLAFKVKQKSEFIIWKFFHLVLAFKAKLNRIFIFKLEDEHSD